MYMYYYVDLGIVSLRMKHPLSGQHYKSDRLRRTDCDN